MGIFNKLFGRKDDTGEAPEFKALMEGSMEGLRLQNQAHSETWGLGKSERWDFTQDTGELIFTFPDKIVRAPAQIIGSFNSEASSWLWAWANPSIMDSLKGDSVKVQEYGEKRNFKPLTTAKWQAQEADCWHMTALANRLCNRNGAYRGPAGTTFVFFTFGEIQISKRA